jgi:hypothetical protein
LTRVSPENVLDEGLRIGGRGPRMNSKVKSKIMGFGSHTLVTTTSQNSKICQNFSLLCRILSILYIHRIHHWLYLDFFKKIKTSNYPLWIWKSLRSSP